MILRPVGGHSGGLFAGCRLLPSALESSRGEVDTLLKSRYFIYRFLSLMVYFTKNPVYSDRW